MLQSSLFIDYYIIVQEQQLLIGGFAGRSHTQKRLSRVEQRGRRRRKEKKKENFSHLYNSARIHFARMNSFLSEASLNPWRAIDRPTDRPTDDDNNKK